MKAKLLNSYLIVSSLIGYLEWGNNKHTYLVQAEIEVLLKIFSDPISVLHPFTVLPLLGQLLLLVTLLLKHENKIITYSGIGGIGILMVLIFFIGCISVNFKMIISTIPFLFISGMIIKHYKTLAKK